MKAKKKYSWLKLSKKSIRQAKIFAKCGKKDRIIQVPVSKIIEYIKLLSA